MPSHPHAGPGGARRRVRMADVAQRCGVSISTVSLVLSGDPRIPEDTARRIIQTVQAMQYRPSILARSLARKISRTVGVILPEHAFVRNKAFYAEALAGIHSQTQPAGFKLVVEAANRTFLARRYYLRMLREQSADAMIYLAATLNDAALNEVEKESFPFVLLGAYVDGLNLPCARGDDEQGAQIATRHLIELGHRAIGLIAGSTETSHGRDREKGYRRAMAAAGLAVQADWVVAGPFGTAEAEKATVPLLSSGVTAIFAAGDAMAYGVLRALRIAGRRVPEEISVIGMDDLEMSEWMNPPLTTVRYDIQSIAAAAAKWAMRRAQSPLIQRIALTDAPPPTLVLRSTTATPK